MRCTSCGHEIGSDQRCSSCGAVVPTNASEAPPNGVAFVSATPPTLWQRSAPIILVVAGLLLWGPILALNYLKALRWAGIMNAEASGYMIGGCLFSLLIGLFAMFLVAKIRGKKSALPKRFFGVSLVTLFFSFLTFVGSLQQTPSRAYRSVGELLRQAAGNKPQTQDANWWDGPTRDFFHDLLDRNEQYIAEVKALDSSAIKNLYSADSYAGVAHMQKVVSQLRATNDVEEKYASIEPVLKRMRDRVASAHAPKEQKQEFLTGMEGSLNRSLKPREEALRTERLWMDSTLELYEFMLAHSSDYSIRDAKLYFSDSALRKQFTTLQAKAIEFHNDFLRAKAAFDHARKNNMDQLGVSPSELTPAQLGKAH